MVRLAVVIPPKICRISDTLVFDAMAGSLWRYRAYLTSLARLSALRHWRTIHRL